MKILVTGGAGFIGSHFIKQMLISEFVPDEVLVLDSLTYAGNLENLKECLGKPNVKFVHADITNRDAVLFLMQDIDIVVNFAAESHVDRSIKNGLDFVRTNVLGTQILLDAALKNKVEKFVQISTDEVYGSIGSGSWSEDEILSPNSPYSASKASADLLAISYFRTHGLNISITRCSNNYGTHQHPEKMIPASINNLLNGGNIQIYGDGKNTRDWLHVTDHCRAIEAVVFNGKAGEIYNIGGGTEINNLELANLLLEIMQLDKNRVTHVLDRKGHDFRYSVNYTKIKDELGYNPIIDFKMALLETIEWYKFNQRYWKTFNK